MRRIASLAVALAAVAASAAAAPASRPQTGERPDVTLPLEGTVVEPTWVKTPNGADFARYYPFWAQLLGLGGRTLIRCRVSVLGELASCKVMQETPAGMGFGQAALSMAQFFRMRPKTIDGDAVGGGRIDIPIHFQPAPEPAPPARIATAASLPAGALELARKVVGVRFGADPGASYRQRLEASLAPQMAGVSLTEQQQEALRDYVSALASAAVAQTDDIASAYARQFTEAQLRDIADFFESPAGKAWVKDAAEVSLRQQQVWAQLTGPALFEARRAFCAKFSCLPQDAPTSAAAAK